MSYLRGDGDGAERARMAQHALECEACARLFESVAIEQGIEDGPDVPDAVVDAAVGLFRDPRALRPSTAQRARLVYCGLLPVPPGSAQASRQVRVYETDDLRVQILHHLADVEAWAVSLEGWLSEPRSGRPLFGDVTLLAEGLGALARASTDDSGAFSLHSPSASATHLLVQIAGPHAPVELDLALA